MFCPGWQKRHGMFCSGGKNGLGCFVWGDKNCMGCFVRGGKSLWDFVRGGKKWHGMFCPGMFCPTFGECMNILKSNCKVCYHVELLGHSALILEIYIAFDIILICLTDDCFINKLKLRDRFKSNKKVPSRRLQWLFTHPSM